jgi:hypothetical protein
MTRCPDCNSPNIDKGVTYDIPEALEQATRCTCNDCGATFESYSDVTDREERRDLQSQAEIQQYERPF